MDVLNDISKIGRNLIINEPFYGLFLSSLNKKISKSLPTAGVCKNGLGVQLLVNPDFWENELNKNTRYGVLQHELLHVCLFHLSLRDGFPDKILFNIAADISINQMIKPEYKNQLFLNVGSFGNIGLEEFKDTRYYYDKLKEEKEKGTNQQLMNMCNELTDDQCQSLANHSSWKEFDKLSDADKKLVKSQLEYQLKNTAQEMKSRGTIPGELKELIDSLLNPTPPSFDWKGYLRRFAGGSNEVYTKKIRRKQSHRYPDNPGLKIKQKKHILIGVDTSGSVTNEEYIEFMTEIHHIWKTGVRITICESDASIQDLKEYKGKFDGKRTGYGGTDFTPIVNYYNQNLSHYTSLIYLTDGRCSAPDNNPKRKMLWCICSSGDINIDLPGYKIQIK